MGFYVERQIPESCEKCELIKWVGVDKAQCLWTHEEFSAWDANCRRASCPMKAADLTVEVFTSSELELISNGLGALIERVYEAKKLTAGSDTCAAAIDKYVEQIEKLIIMVCDMMED